VETKNEIDYKEQRQEIKAIKIKSALDKKTKRDEKRECAKRKREQTMQKLKENRAAKQKQKEDKKRETQPDTRKTKKQKQETRNTIRDSLLRQKRKKKLKWDQAIQRLKEDRATKLSKNRQDTLTRSPQNKINKRKRDQGSYHVQKKQKKDTNPPEEDGETKHPCSTHITKKPPDKS
jgi:hypothetical protein